MSNWETITLDEWVKAGDIELGRGNIISKDDINNFPGPYPIYSSSAHNNGKFGEYAKFMFDEELITWSVDGGGNLFYRPKHRFSVTNVCGFMRVKSEKFHAPFIYYSLTNQHKKLTFDYTTKAHPSVIRKLYWLPKIDANIQKRISSILQTIDQAIEKTEALIDKYQQIKVGLMDDLFTRGIGADGKLRPPRGEAPELYQLTPTGWIPKDWNYAQIKHYVRSAQYGISTSLSDSEVGIPVLRMNNIQSNKFDIADLKYTTDLEAFKIMLRKGDVLYNRTNSMEHVGKIAIWRDELQECSFASYLVRINLYENLVLPEFFSYWMSQVSSQNALRRYATPAVQQVNINPTNLQRVYIACPQNIKEQRLISEKIDILDIKLSTEKITLDKLRDEKSGLMHDLLTGKVQVPINRVEAAHV